MELFAIHGDYAVLSVSRLQRIGPGARELPRENQLIVLLDSADIVLCEPLAVSEVTPKYHVPAVRPVTTYCTVAGFDTWIVWVNEEAFVP
jgi:hypothetical protein